MVEGLKAPKKNNDPGYEIVISAGGTFTRKDGFSYTQTSVRLLVPLQSWAISSSKPVSSNLFHQTIW